jgi:hypothetical protein
VFRVASRRAVHAADGGDLRIKANDRRPDTVTVNDDPGILHRCRGVEGQDVLHEGGGIRPPQRFLITSLRRPSGSHSMPYKISASVVESCTAPPGCEI